MRIFHCAGNCWRTKSIALLALLVLGTSGCFWRREKAEKPPAAFTVKSSGGNTNLTMAPAASAVGRVASVNPQAKFAVVIFPIGQVPPTGTRLSVFHAGTKAGELKITGPTQDTLTVGDIVSGAAQEGDEVRAE